MDLIEKDSIADLANWQRHPWEIARLDFVQWMIKKNIPLNPGDHVLDLGCGDCFVVDQLSETYDQVNFSAVDIEFDQPTLNKLNQKFENKSVEAYVNLEDIPNIKTKPIALVLLLDVIEHIEDEISFLQNLMQFEGIDANTKFLITVPAHQNLFCYHDVILKHFRRYNNRSLKLRANSAGLKPETVGYFFATLLPFRILEVFKEKVRKPKPVKQTRLSNWQGGTMITKMLINLLRLDFRIAQLFRTIGIKIPGLSNYAILKPKSLT